jgi:hypothetical protein
MYDDSNNNRNDKNNIRIFFDSIAWKYSGIEKDFRH